jgi:hypothetical protein
MCKNKQLYVCRPETTKYLVWSSFSFMIPSLYAYMHELYFFCGLCFFTSLISANYWRKPTYSLRRDLDLVFSKASFVIFAYNGSTHVVYVPYLFSSYSLLFVSLCCFYLSNKYAKENKNWVFYHMIFHYTIMAKQMIILDSMK